MHQQHPGAPIDHRQVAGPVVKANGTNFLVEQVESLLAG